MFWIKKDTIERKLADAMGFEYCTLFDSARSALRNFNVPYLPSNVCPVLGELFPDARRLPTDSETGLSHAAVQLYGYRQKFKYYPFELDPLMTGYLRAPCAANVIISFGRKKMLDIGGGGALLSNEPFKGYGNFPEGLRDVLAERLKYFWTFLENRWKQVDEWDRHLGDSCVHIPREQIMPWRVIRRIPEKLGSGSRDAVVKALREAGHAVGTNYPPLPGVTDPGAIQWGREVINFFPEEPDIPKACEIIKRAIG